MVMKLSSLVKDKVKSHLGDCFLLAEENPALLVRACEVMVQIQESNRLKYLAMGPEEKEIIPEHDVTLQFTNECVAHLETAFDSRIQSQYSRYIFQAADEGKNGMEATLGAATRGMVDMAVLKEDICRCFPPHINVMSIYRSRFELYVTPQVSALYSQNMGSLDNADLLRMVSWLYEYNLQRVNLQIASNEQGANEQGANEQGAKIEEFEEAVEDLMEEYTKGMRTQTSEWIRNIEKLESEPIQINQTTDRHYITQDPEELLRSVYETISVCRTQLPRALACQAITAIVAELKESIGRQTEALEEDWKDMEIRKICAVVNDSFRMQDKCENLIEFAGDDASEAATALKNAMDDLCTGYVEFAQLATKLCAHSVMLDVTPDILEDVFTQRWEDGEELVLVACTTLRDYFGDLEIWLPEYFFSKLARECYEQTLKCYLGAVFRRRKSFNEPARVAQQMVKDRVCLFDLFGIERAESLFAGGLREEGALERQLGTLTAMSRVLLAQSVHGCTAEITSLLTEFGAQGEAAVNALVGMRKNDTKEIGKEWKGGVGNLAAAAAAAAGDKAGVVHSHFGLPFKVAPSATSSPASAAPGSSPRGKEGPASAPTSTGKRLGKISNPFGTSKGGPNWNSLMKSIPTKGRTAAAPSPDS